VSPPYFRCLVFFSEFVLKIKISFNISDHRSPASSLPISSLLTQLLAFSHCVSENKLKNKRKQNKAQKSPNILSHMLLTHTHTHTHTHQHHKIRNHTIISRRPVMPKESRDRRIQGSEKEAEKF